MRISIWLSVYLLGIYGAQAQQTAHLSISTSLEVDFLVTDPLGRRTGRDPRVGDGLTLKEIPRSSYSTESVGDTPIDYEPQDGDNYQLFAYRVGMPGTIGTYVIDVIGIESAVFRIAVSIHPTRGSLIKPFLFNGRGIIEKDGVLRYTLWYTGVADEPIRFEKMVLPATLRQDLGNSYKLKLLGEQGFYKELSNSLDSYEKHLSKKDTLKAVKEVEKFQDRITGEYNERPERNDKRFITTDAWKILYDDAQYLIAHLIQLPSKPVGLTLLQQLDSLKAGVQRQQSKMNLGGTLLVKGLLLSLDQAKKQLQQADSAKAAIAVRVFQLVVDETHELTDALLEKHKPLPSLYVKDEAYIQLHYRAKYILEALPEPRIDIHQHRLQMVDKELQKELDALKQMTEQK